MSARRCGACGKTGARKLSRAFVPADNHGRVVPALVCARGIARAVVVVPNVVNGCICGRPATTCDACAEKRESAAKKAGADATRIVRKLLQTSRAYRANELAEGQGDDGIAEGLRIAASLVERGNF